MNSGGPQAQPADPFAILFRACWKGRRQIRNWLLVFGALGLLLAIALPNRYQATAILDLNAEQSSSRSMAMGMLQGFGGLGQFFGGRTQSDRVLGILESREALCLAVNDPACATYLGGKGSVSRRVKKLARMIRHKAGLQTGLLTLELQLSSKKWFPLIRRLVGSDLQADATATARATAHLLQVSIEGLDTACRKLNRTSATREVSFLEKRVLEAESELTKAENELAAYKIERGKVDPMSANRALDASILRMREQLLQLRISRRSLEDGLSPQHPTVLQLNARIDAVAGQLGDLIRPGERGQEHAVAPLPDGQGFLLPLYSAPGVELAFSRMVRNTVLRASVYAVLLRQLEAARIMAVRDAPIFQLLDRPVPPMRPAGPSRLLYLLAFLFLGAVLAVTRVVFAPTLALLRAWADRAGGA